MRALTDAQALALSLADRSTHVRVKIDRGSSDWIDLSQFCGYDWIHSVDYGGSEDNPVQVATVKLFKKAYDLNLAPLLDGSKLNQVAAVVDIGNSLIVEIAVLGMDQQPVEADWVEVHRGEIDDINWSSSPITIKSRDQGGTVVDTFMESSEVYGAATGRAMEDVLQDILTEHMPSAVTLYSENGSGGTPFNPSDSPGFNILQYQQDQEGVMSALRRICQLIGADVGYKWHANTSAFQLVFQQPGRAISAQGTLNLSSTLPLNNETFVVNATTFTAKTSGAGTDEFNIGADQRETADNIVAMYNAGSEKNNSWAHRDSSDDVVFTWTPGVAGDSITFTEAMTGTTADGGGTLGGTTAGSDGTTAAVYTFGPDRYLKVTNLAIERQDIRNVVHVMFQDSNKDVQEVVLTDNASIVKYGRRYMKITEAAGSQIDTYDEALTFAGAALADLREPDLKQSVSVPFFWPAEVGDNYTFEANGEDYDTDQTLSLIDFKHTITQQKATTTLTVRGKPSGGRKRWLKIQGYPGIAPVTTERIGPYHENRVSQSFDQLLRNADLNIFTRGRNLPPDNWNVVSPDSWGSSGQVYWTAGAASGDYAVTIDVTSGNQDVVFQSDFMPIATDDLLRAAMLAQGDVSESSTDVDLCVRWYDLNKIYLSQSETAITLNNGSYETRQSGIFTAPSSARFCTVRVAVHYVDADYTATIDRISLVRELPQWRRVKENSQSQSTSDQTIDWDHGGQSFEYGIDYNTSTDEHTVKHPGIYQIILKVNSNDNTSRANSWFLHIDLQCDTGGGYSSLVASQEVATQPSAAVAARATVVLQWIGSLNAGDKLRVRSRVSSLQAGVASNILVTFPGSAYQGQMLLRADR